MADRTYITEGKDLPKWTNPISHAVVANGICFVSGQLSVGLDGAYVPGTVREEAERAFENFFAVLNAAGFSREQVVFVDIAFADISQLEEVNALFVALFPEGSRPARTVYQVAALPFGGKVKVMGTAVR